MDKVVLSPSKPSKTPPEKTLKLLHERLNLAEEEAKKLSGQLTEYGFKAGVHIQNDGKGSAVEAVTPFRSRTPVDEVQYELLRKEYERLVTRVCRTESTVQSLKLALVSLEAENSLMSKHSATETLTANEAYERELIKLKKELVSCRKQLDDSERFRTETDKNFDEVRKCVGGVNGGTHSQVVEKVFELKKTREKLTKRVNELQKQVNHEQHVRIGLEESHKDLLERVTDMEGVVERENGEMKLLSGDCTTLKQELSNTRTQCEREHQTRVQLEKLVDRLNGELEEMESNLLTMSNERKMLDADLSKFKRDNKEHKQQLQLLQKSCEKLQEVNLDLEQRLKETSAVLHLTENDNKVLVTKHRDVVENERVVFEQKLRDQDKLLDEAKESILQELIKEKQTSVSREKESLKLKSELILSRKFLEERDAEVMNLKRVLEELKTERDKMVEENEKAIVEIRHDLDRFASDKITIEAEHSQTKVSEFYLRQLNRTSEIQEERSRVKERNQILEEECEKLRSRLMDLEQQQTNQHRVNSALETMLEDKRRLAYEKGVLQSEVEKLNHEVSSLSHLKNENERLTYILTTSDKKYNDVHNKLQEVTQKLRNSEADTRKMQSILAEREKETEFLLRNKNEALKETERMIKVTDNHEKKYTKKIESLQKTLLQSKEDNMKLASTLETVITSHTQLQATTERLQTELGKRDSQAKYIEEERSKMQSVMSELSREVDELRHKLTEECEPRQVEALQRALDVMKDDRGELMRTVEPLMTTNKDLQESLEKLAKEVARKNGEIRHLKDTLSSERKEGKVEKRAKESEVDEMKKQSDKGMKDLEIKHKKILAKLRKEYQDMVNIKNTVKEENQRLKREQQEEGERQRKLKEKLRFTKTQFDQCLKQRSAHEKEIDMARQKIEAMSRELATLEHLKSEYSRNNMEQARSLQEFVSQLTDLQEEFRRLSEAQEETSLLCRRKDDLINKEKLKRKEYEIQCLKLHDREQQLLELRNSTERKLQEANFESHQVAANLQEAHEWFKGKFTNLQSELTKSKKLQSILEKDNVDQYKALQDEKRRAEAATEKAKEIIKSSRMMITKLVGQALDVSDETAEIREAMAAEQELRRTQFGGKSKKSKEAVSSKRR